MKRGPVLKEIMAIFHSTVVRKGGSFSGKKVISVLILELYIYNSDV